MVSTQRQPEFRSHIAAESLFEVCEQRLVLSAQLLAEVLNEPAGEGFAPGLQTTLQPQLHEAHAATGNDFVQENFGLTGRGQTVAVIDSGVTWDHVALGGGYGPGYRVVGGWDFAENDAQPYDDGPSGFHGTHVTGILGSDSDIAPGVARDVDLVALRVFDDVGTGKMEWVESALRWVNDNRDSFENPITTVNLSIGTSWNSEDVPSWATLEDELKALYDNGIVVTAAAGNSFQDYDAVGLTYPASSQYVLPVSSVDADGSLSSFSQRSGSVIAAPGSHISSTVPDHFLGRDGTIDDFSTASGTSMAAPYVAGASVLVRQAMELSGWDNITSDTISSHLRNTADSIFDSATGLNYNRLDLQAAIESILPQDAIGDFAHDASSLDLNAGQLNTWINTLGDTDVYRFTADANAMLSLDASSEWVDDLSWSITSAGSQLAVGGQDPAEVELVAGLTYELHVTATQSIGPANFSFELETLAGNQPSGPAEQLGTVDYLENQADAGSSFDVTASQAGIFTIQWQNADQATGEFLVRQADGTTLSDASWEAGSLRIDLDVAAGEQLRIELPGTTLADTGQLTLVNLVSQQGSVVNVSGTAQRDVWSLNLQDGLQIGIGSVNYAFSTDSISEVQMNASLNNDRIDMVGSHQIDQVDLRPQFATIENQDLRIRIEGVEQVYYASGGGADQVYLYDSDGDDRLHIRPGSAELVGTGYQFEVSEVARIHVHATGSGEDQAYLYDSTGDDHLSVRPQFTSLRGDGFFNMVRGFERIYAYSGSSDNDTASLYDSSGNDLFATSGTSASITGPGFASHTRGYEDVAAHSSAGGNDRAALYGSDATTQWRHGTDFTSFHETEMSREARGFQQVDTFVASQSVNVAGTSVRVTDEPAFEGNTPAPEPLGSLSHRLAFAFELESIERAADRLHLPEEDLLADTELERSILDETFRLFDELFDR